MLLADADIEGALGNVLANISMPVPTALRGNADDLVVLLGS